MILKTKNGWKKIIPMHKAALAPPYNYQIPMMTMPCAGKWCEDSKMEPLVMVEFKLVDSKVNKKITGYDYIYEER